jgi:predicted kinase
MFVLVAGPPASGKSTVATALARALGLPLLAKDDIKEALMDALGPPEDVAESRRFGRAAVMAMLTIARSMPGAVLDSTFYPYTVAPLRQLPGPLIEVRCRCPREIVAARYAARSRTRHAGHLDTQRASDELWNDHHLRPLGLGPLVEVDTSRPLQTAEVARLIREQADGADARCA